MDEAMHQTSTPAGSPGARAASAGALRKNGTPGKPLRILLVEDSPLLRGRLENMLSQHAAFKVTGLAAAEAEAIEKLDSVPYDAIVVDVELRPGSGIGVIRQARARNKDAKDGHVWIIVLTNYDLPTVRERCMQAGADHFLDKMREIDQLIPILLGIAGRKP
ncbi:MAG TPA: response regulator [Steroidobacteraceae bacterium]|jgi:DNA-binding NarL/FixJ family response regulator|nr:response regulator [Steroidobacteraceae bacterium]